MKKIITNLFQINQTAPVKRYLPVLNIPSEDYRLRTEVTHCFSEHNITFEKLTFRDQLNLHKLKETSQLLLTLVDHNILLGDDAVLEPKVTEVIDHRKLERKESNRFGLSIEVLNHYK